jgi:tripartite-type tricarboxylate transporter receptor subunit TctC
MARTPAEAVHTLTDAWKNVAAMPDVVERLAALSAAAVGSTAEELAELTRAETGMWGEVVKARAITPAQ